MHRQEQLILADTDCVFGWGLCFFLEGPNLTPCRLQIRCSAGGCLAVARGCLAIYDLQLSDLSAGASVMTCITAALDVAAVAAQVHCVTL